MKTDGMFTGLRWRDLQTIAGTWLVFAFRSGGGVVSLFMVIVLATATASISFNQMEQWIPRGGDETLQTERMDAFARQVGAGITFSDDEEIQEREIEHLLEKRPAIFSVLMIAIMWIIPFASCAVAFNQTASDIGNRGLRFLLSRTERPNIFIGRQIGAMVFMVLAVFVLVALIAAFVYLKVPNYEAGAMSLAAGECYLALIGFSLPYITLCAWISSTQRTPFSALLLCYVAALGSALLLGILATTIGELIDAPWLDRISPWAWKTQLLSESTTIRLRAFGVMFGFSAIFMLAGLYNFKKRDL